MVFEPTYPYDIEDFKSKEYTLSKRREYMHFSALKDAEKYVAEFRKTLNPKRTRWHLERLEEHCKGLDYEPHELNELKGIYTETLVKRTKKLARDKWFLSMVDLGLWFEKSK